MFLDSLEDMPPEEREARLAECMAALARHSRLIPQEVMRPDLYPSRTSRYTPMLRLLAADDYEYLKSNAVPSEGFLGARLVIYRQYVFRLQRDFARANRIRIASGRISASDAMRADVVVLWHCGRLAVAGALLATHRYQLALNLAYDSLRAIEKMIHPTVIEFPAPA